MTMGDVTVAANITLAETVKTTTLPHYTNTSAPTSDGPDRPVFITVFASKFIGLHDFFVLEIIKCVLHFLSFPHLTTSLDINRYVFYTGPSFMLIILG